MSKIVAVRKNSYGNLEAFKLDDGRELDYITAYDMVVDGKISGVIATTGKDNSLIIRSMPDGDPSNNLDNLPVF